MHDPLIPYAFGILGLVIGSFFELKARTKLDADQKSRLRSSSRATTMPLLTVAVVVVLLSIFKDKFGPLNKIAAFAFIAIMALVASVSMVRVEKKYSALSLSAPYYELHRRSLIALCAGAGIILIIVCVHLIML